MAYGLYSYTNICLLPFKSDYSVNAELEPCACGY